MLRLLTHPETGAGRLIGRGFSWRPITWLGLISYSVYLWHPVILQVATDDVGIRTWPEKIATAPLIGSLILSVSWASYRWVEQPFQRLKDRRVPEPEPSSAVNPTASGALASSSPLQASA